ncbi:MAG: hypothetical protein HND27_08165 [Bacteroidetes bacterium]|nr:hypothetical protein [Bacteroidota bacterium]MBV6461650.1 hypothetical protein [Flavobacteriales bacterium]WKZ74128.1 MAG: hypothetical protein QY303_08205 [Vicingaceae bacterium]MCL4816801.1 hypothetical protein [Flavobacteriales bacterium]NOG95739.1 hypothetical protein [Bacteroidota bacterium]
MKAYKFILPAMLLLSAFSFAQKSTTKEEIEAMKVAFITKYVGLTPQESEKFWPIFNEYESKQKTLKTTYRDFSVISIEEINKLSDSELQKLIDNHGTIKQKEIELFNEYNSKFLSVLPVKKVAKLYLSREEFKKHLLQKIREQPSK